MLVQKHSRHTKVIRRKKAPALMQFISGLILLLLLIHSFKAEAQADSTRSRIDVDRIKNEAFGYSQIKTNPLTVLWGAIPFTSEYRLTWESSTHLNQYFNIGAAWLGKNIILFKGMTSIITNPSSLKLTGFHVHVNYRWIINNEKIPKGFYIGPHVSWANVRMEHDASSGLNDHAIIEHIHAAVLFGYQAGLLDVFYIDFFAGIGYKENDWWNSTKLSSQKLIDMGELNWVYESHLKLKAGFSVGIRIK